MRPPHLRGRLDFEVLRGRLASYGRVLSFAQEREICDVIHFQPVLWKREVVVVSVPKCLVVSHHEVVWKDVVQV